MNPSQMHGKAAVHFVLPGNKLALVPPAPKPIIRTPIMFFPYQVFDNGKTSFDAI